MSTCTSRSLLLPLQSSFFMASQPPVTAGATGTAAASIEDIFDSSLNLEETHFNDGFTEGYNAGLISGKEEAKQVGLKFGFQVGEELGFYRGCVDVWNSAIEVDLTRFSSRVQKSIKQMEELLQKYPYFDPDDESAQEIMDNLRLKFRAICATLSVKLEYNGFLKSSSEAKDIEF